MEYRRNGVLQKHCRHLLIIKMIWPHHPDVVVAQAFYLANEPIASSTKTRSMLLISMFIQHSSTPVLQPFPTLQYSNTPLLQPAIVGKAYGRNTVTQPWKLGLQYWIKHGINAPETIAVKAAD